jgi:hypothetical protein
LEAAEVNKVGAIDGDAEAAAWAFPIYATEPVQEMKRP